MQMYVSNALALGSLSGTSLSPITTWALLWCFISYLYKYFFSFISINFGSYYIPDSHKNISNIDENVRQHNLRNDLLWKCSCNFLQMWENGPYSTCDTDYFPIVPKMVQSRLQLVPLINKNLFTLIMTYNISYLISANARNASTNS